MPVRFPDLTVGYALALPEDESPPRTAREAVQKLMARPLHFVTAKLAQVLHWASLEWKRTAPGTGDPPALIHQMVHAWIFNETARLEDIYEKLVHIELQALKEPDKPLSGRRVALSRTARYLSHAIALLLAIENNEVDSSARTQLWSDVTAGLEAALSIGGPVMLTRWWYDPVPVQED